MKWWYWLILELLIIFGVMVWIYFFPCEFEDDFAKGMIGFVLIYTIEDCKDIKRRDRMSENYTMFETEAEEYVKDSFRAFVKGIREIAKIAFKKGAEFGYNKANEWHRVDEGKYPSKEQLGESFVVAFAFNERTQKYYSFDCAEYIDKGMFCTHTNNDDKVIAWKEIVLPKESE